MSLIDSLPLAPISSRLLACAWPLQNRSDRVSPPAARHNRGVSYAGLVVAQNLGCPHIHFVTFNRWS
jgi:hypothetical protein